MNKEEILKKVERQELKKELTIKHEREELKYFLRCLAADVCPLCGGKSVWFDSYCVGFYKWRCESCRTDFRQICTVEKLTIKKEGGIKNKTVR